MYISDRTFPWPRFEGLHNKRTVILNEELFVEGTRVPKGTEIITIKTRNFGFAILPQNMGFQRRIFKY